MYFESGVAMLKLLIFDLDGTLVNSVADLADAANYALKNHGYPIHEEEKYNYFVGDGVWKLLERVLPESDRTNENINALHEDFAQYYNVHYRDKTRPYDGIPEVLEELRRHGYMLAVASNKPDEFTKTIVNYFFPKTFSYIQGGLDGVPKKPEPQIVFSIMDKLSVSSEECLFIGDTNVDIFTGKNSGIRTVGCLWGFRDYEELYSAGADEIILDPKELLDITNQL